MYRTGRYKIVRSMSQEIPIPAALPRGGDVRDRRVVLTGASRGLGRLLAHGGYLLT